MGTLRGSSRLVTNSIGHSGTHPLRPSGPRPGWPLSPGPFLLMPTALHWCSPAVGTGWCVSGWGVSKALGDTGDQEGDVSDRTRHAFH